MCHPAVQGPTLEHIRVSGKILLTQESSDSYPSWFKASLKSWQRVSSATNRKYRVAWCSRMFQLLFCELLQVVTRVYFPLLWTAQNTLELVTGWQWYFNKNWCFSQCKYLARYVFLNFRVSQANYSLSPVKLQLRFQFFFLFNEIFWKCFW